MNDYKNEIIEAHKRGLGSSDAKMVYNIALRKGLSESDRQRVAEMLGLAERPQFSTEATRLGDDIENGIFNVIKSKYPDAVSNPFYYSPEMTKRFGFEISNHIDYEIIVDGKLIWIENKATKYDTNKTLETYTQQLVWHWMLLKEKAKRMRVKPIMFLSHYQTGLSESFDSKNLHFVELKKPKNEQFVVIEKGLAILANEIKGFVYTPREELYSDYLPEKVQEELVVMCDTVSQIKTLETKLEEFKERMTQLMVKANVKSIKNDFFDITLVPEGVTSNFDKKRFGIDHPELLDLYTSQKTRKAYTKINIH